jgi:hypothetical protein
MSLVRVELPSGLADLARCGRRVEVGVEGVVTVRAVLEALERRLPVLRGAVREHGSLQRRKFLRFFVCGEDWSHRGMDEVLPEAVAEGREVFMVVGAVAGG